MHAAEDASEETEMKPGLQRQGDGVGAQGHSPWGPCSGGKKS